MRRHHEALRRELAAAKALAAGDPLLFEVGPVEVEFAVVAKRTGGAKGGVTFGVVTFGAEGSIGRDETHRVKVTLTPKERATGRPTEINDQIDRIPDR